MRARLLKPGFFSNDELAELPPLTRILFAGLWCIADRAGRLDDRPRRIRGEVLPYDDCDADAMLDDLARRGFIRRYQASGRAYIQVVNFLRHQTPHVKEAASTIPAPDEPKTSPVLAPDKHETSPAVPISIPIADPVSVPVSVTATEADASPAGDGHYAPNGANGLVTATVAGSRTVAKPPPTPLPADADAKAREPPWPDAPWIAESFEQTFWPLYPRKTHKVEAKAAWSALMRRQPTFDRALALAESILEAVNEQSGHWRDPTFTPHAATYLRGERWADEIVIATGRPNGRAGPAP